MAKPKFPPISNSKPGQGYGMWQKHFAEERDKMLSLKRRADEFQAKVTAEVVKRKFGGRVQSDFGVFPTTELTKALNQTEPADIGYIKIPKRFADSCKKEEIIDLEVNYEDLQKILRLLMC